MPDRVCEIANITIGEKSFAIQQDTNVPSRNVFTKLPTCVVNVMANIIRTSNKQQDTRILCQTGITNQHGGYTIRRMTYLVHDLSNVPLFINELGTQGTLRWSGRHHQRRQYPLKVPTMTSHCFDNTNQVLNHPIREQHLNWPAQVDIVRLDINAARH